MSDTLRIVLLGATGLVGRAVIAQAVGRDNVRLTAVARREMPLPPGARMEMLVSGTEHWDDAIAAGNPQVAIIALGTTIRAEGGDRTAFRAVDHDLVLACAKAAKAAGARQLIVVSSIGARFSSKNFYLSVKGEVEDRLAKLRFERLDIVRPGLLRGPRDGPARWAETAGQWFAPMFDLFLVGSLKRYRSVRATMLADVILSLAGARPGGRFVHEYDTFERILRR